LQTMCQSAAVPGIVVIAEVADTAPHGEPPARLKFDILTTAACRGARSELFSADSPAGGEAAWLHAPLQLFSGSSDNEARPLAPQAYTCAWRADSIRDSSRLQFAGMRGRPRPAFPLRAHSRPRRYCARDPCLVLYPGLLLLVYAINLGARVRDALGFIVRA
jgi:hypothetical protein